MKTQLINNIQLQELDHPPEPDSPENRLRMEVQSIEDCWYMCVLKITSDRYLNIF